MKSIRLGAVCEKIGSGATPRGGKDAYKGGATTLIRSQNVYNDGFHREGLVRIDSKQAAELRNVEVQHDDVLLNITGDSVARCCQVAPDVLPARVNQHVAIIRPYPSSLDARYLRYVLVTADYQARLLGLASAGATRPALTKAMIEGLDILAPPLPEQRAIAHILGTLDDKIELNRRMNETLEAMARAFFQSWFVDFDPVHRNIQRAQGQTPPSPTSSKAKSTPDPLAEFDALFPDAFEDSELGPIPRGWRVMSLDGIAEFLNGLALQKFPPGEGPSLPVIKIAQLRAGTVSGADRASMSIPDRYHVHNGDVVFSWSGSLECVLWAGGQGALNQHLFKVSSAEYPKWFYYQWVHQHLSDFRLIAAGKATTMGHIQRHHLSDAKVFVPPNDLISAIDQVVAPLVESQWKRAVESSTIAALRDSLLPKLISGELRVKDAEKFVEGAV